MPLHEICRAFLKEPAAKEWLALESMTVEKARRLVGAELVEDEPPAVHSVREFEVPVSSARISARAYRPRSERPCGVLVWLHGGGFVLGSLDSADAECRQLAAVSDALVVAVDYRLAPEYPFPIGVTDCYEALRWVAANRGWLDALDGGLAVGGESAGGALAAAVTLMGRDRGEPHVDLQVLVCPMTCCSSDDLRSRHELGDIYPSSAIEWCWDRYLLSATQADDALASPLLAESFQDLPPALVLTAEYDPLRDEGALYAQRLREGGVAAEHRNLRGLLHGLFAWAANEVPEAVDGLNRVGDVVRTTLSVKEASSSPGSATPSP